MIHSRIPQLFFPHNYSHFNKLKKKKFRKTLWKKVKLCTAALNLGRCQIGGAVPEPPEIGLEPHWLSVLAPQHANA